MGIETFRPGVALPTLKPPETQLFWVNFAAIGSAIYFPDGRMHLRLLDGTTIPLTKTEADAVWQRLQKSGRGFICKP